MGIGLKQSTYRGSVVVIDDEEDMCRILTRYLNLEGYHINSFTEARLALDYIAQYQPDVILTDIKMPDYSGMDILKSVREKYPDTIVIIMTAYATIEGAIQAMKEGAYHYVTKPFNLEEILLTIGKAVEMSHLSREQSVFSEQIRRAYADLSLVGKSPAIEEVKRILEKISPTDSSVLIIGESGTGKELVANAIHKTGPRADKAFVAVNCGALPRDLLENKLFGHEAGAFTGATSMKRGLFEAADGGTL
ncbi:MAG TPA: sigma-54 dependent transcriptional regulator, partial [Candidatus Sumerlaeota bacterium]|nr:sigma-54 dependent transcriptional regulator [Candidatus Sumerlaeota bacterium]